MSFFSFYVMRSTLQRREFCVHSRVTWYEESRAEQALLRFSEYIYDCKNLQFSSKVILHTIFTVIPEISSTIGIQFSVNCSRSILDNVHLEEIVDGCQ